MRFSALCFMALQLAFNTFSLAQVNLIPNPSFEDIILCPSEASYYSQMENVPPWFSASNGTPDIFNPCCTDVFYCVPYNFGPFYDPVMGYSANYQPPRTGEGYAGLEVFDYLNPHAREYMSVKTLETLKQNTLYYIHFHVANFYAEGSSYFAPCYTDGIGLALSQERIDTVLHYGDPLLIDPVLENKSILRDTQNWTKISGVYRANGENYILIGNFKPYAETQVDDQCYDVAPNMSYLFIDEVGVFEFDPLPDTVLMCKEETLKLGQGFLDATYRWNTGATDSTIVVQESGLYIVDVFIDDLKMSDTTLVLENDYLISLLPKDTIICEGDTLEIDIVVPGDYEWEDGSASGHLEISEAGAYSLQVSNACGTTVHQFFVETDICNCNVYVPNAFSPNDDGRNDRFSPYISCDFPYEIKLFRIYNRWGGLVYESVGEEKAIWDGTVNGTPASADTYLWQLEYDYLHKGRRKENTKSGTVNLIR